LRIAKEFVHFENYPFFLGSTSVLRTESTFLQGFEIQAKEGGARIFKNTQEVS
jgi:hypothetical protein